MAKSRTKKAESCFQCTAILYGRSDKVYCSKRCQNAHFKEIKEQFIYLDEIRNKGQIRNCIVAEGILGQDLKKVEVSKRTLFKHNFDLFSFEKVIWTKKKRKFKIGHFVFWIKKNGNVVLSRVKKTSVTCHRVYKRWDGEFLWRIGRYGNLLERKDLDITSEGIMAMPFVLKYHSRKNNFIYIKYHSD